MGNNVNAAPVIDTSYSMTSNGYVDITKRDSKAFVSYFRPGDGLGVVNYDTNGRLTYSNNGQLAIVSPGMPEDIAAANAIQALSFIGTCTNIGGGIQSARSMLDSAADPRGIVLLSDGYQNCGTDPLTVLPSYPIYSCAMGPHADTQLMQQIATNTNGEYYNAPYPSTMMFIYNQIRGVPDFVDTVQNKMNQIQPTGYALVPATIGSSESGSQFGVVWDDTSLQYTTSSNPGANQISITLVLPNGQISPQAPDIVGSGYVVYNIDTPAVGTWYAQVIPGSGSPQVQVTTGAFEFPADPEASPKLKVSAQLVEPGEPMKVEARLHEAGEPIDGATVQGSVTQPELSIANALERYRDQLAQVSPDQGDLDAGMPEDRARLAALHRLLLPRHDILPQRSYPLHFTPAGDGTYHAVIDDTHQAGSYSVRVSARGRSPRTERPIQRTEHIARAI